MLKSKIWKIKGFLREESAEHPTLPLPVRGRCPMLSFDVDISLFHWVNHFCKKKNKERNKQNEKIENIEKCDFLFSFLVYVQLGHLPLASKGRVGCSALSSPKNPLIFRIFDFGIFDFRFWHFRFSILTYRFWLHELVSGTLSYIICMRLTHLDTCFCLISVLNVTNFGFMENFDFCTFFFSNFKVFGSRVSIRVSTYYACHKKQN